MAWRGTWWLLGVALTLCGTARSQTLAHRNWAGSGMTVAPWWAGAELYEVDPIDFADSNGDGFGDLRGIAGRLDYLQALGVDSLVISSMPLRLGSLGTQQAGGALGGQPFDAVNGTVEDFDQLVEAAAAHKMRVMVDLRLRDDETEGETLAAGRFWLSRGVAGLRVVADSRAPVSAAVAAERIRELRRLCLGFAGQRVVLSAVGGGAETAVAVRRRGHAPGSTGNASGASVAEAGAQMVEDARLLHAVSMAALRGLVRTSGGAGAGGAERVPVTDADGVARSWNRLSEEVGGGAGSGSAVGSGNGAGTERGGSAGASDGPGARAAVAKAAAAVLLLGGGSPLVYFGQELGMAGAGGPEPMQWGAAHPFTTGTPWIEMGPNADAADVTAEEGEADSVLHWYRTLGELRRGNAALRPGSVEVLATGNGEVLVWERRARLGEREAASVVVMVNLSGQAEVASASGVAPQGLRVLASTFALAATVVSGGITLPGYGVFVGEVKKAAGLETVVIPPKARRR